MPHLGQCHDVRCIARGFGYVMPYIVCGIARGFGHFVALVETLFVPCLFLSLIQLLIPCGAVADNLIFTRHMRFHLSELSGE